MKRVKHFVVFFGICFSMGLHAQVVQHLSNTPPGVSSSRPSLIPLPRQLNWGNGSFSLSRAAAIVCPDKTLLSEAAFLQKQLVEKGWDLVIKNKPSRAENAIELRLDTTSFSSDLPEAYSLNVQENHVLLKASTRHGIFNGIQTLRQLLKNDGTLDECDIKDWPAFSWRGYMIDVGRNYMPMHLLKEQIDIMALYKLNVFHFHPTEDIAWRIFIKQYPQLTAPENMLRHKGDFYSEADIKELIDYCTQRHITFVPEIDMPGHSDAFKRAMKVDMQSDSGQIYLKNILKEFCTTYDVPYIHIGSDEVNITNVNFIPQMSAYIEGFGKKVIGWQPGGNLSASSIRQRWMADNGYSGRNPGIQFIDSRHLYLNHMDPFESVVTIFNRQMADRDQGDSLALGATLCMWHDRAINAAEDILGMNPVYPGMVAFSERTWRGGGQPGWVANISDGDFSQFQDFENRLLIHKQRFFGQKAFSYIKQRELTWKLHGPYFNSGDLNAAFEPETRENMAADIPAEKNVVGATIVLKHWWAPHIKGAIDEPGENTTWYASTKMWSDRDEVGDFWIGFNNISRSPATNSPPVGKWDDKESRLWVNGKQIDPPQWKRAGQKGHPEIPLVDEGYEFREPTSIPLKKGWNTVLLKLPIGSFKGPDWQNPVKWMFTFVRVN